MSNNAKNNFINGVLDFPVMLEKSIPYGFDISGIKKPKNVFVAGMGGSAVGADLAAGYLGGELRCPLTIIRSYDLPAHANKDDLLVLISYSGNTEETLAVFKAGLERGLTLAVITSGGRLKILSEKHNLPHIVVPAGIQPRSALPYLLVSLLKIFEKAQLIPSHDRIIAKSARLLLSRKSEFSSRAKELAGQLNGKIPLVFSSAGVTEAIGYRLKCQFNENSKTISHHAVFPELDHNEIVSLAGLKKGQHNFALIILRDKEEPLRVKKRIEITKSLIAANIGWIRELRSVGEDRLSRMLSLVFLGDLLSCYLAENNRQDPEDVKIIEKLKAELKR